MSAIRSQKDNNSDFRFLISDFCMCTPTRSLSGAVCVLCTCLLRASASPAKAGEWKPNGKFRLKKLASIHRGTITFFISACLLALTFISPANAYTSPVVSEVIDSITLRLDNNQTVRLAGIVVPRNTRSEASEFLRQTLVKHAIKLTTGATPVERHGYILAHAQTEKGLWIQGSLLEAGLALAYPNPDNNLLVKEMLKVEAKARAKKLGMWSSGFSILSADDTAHMKPGSFAIVEGTIVSTKKQKTATYLNFGNDWRTDFTILVRPATAKLLEKSGIELTNLAEKKIQVRGWLEKYNGPMIEVREPSALAVY